MKLAEIWTLKKAKNGKPGHLISERLHSWGGTAVFFNEKNIGILKTMVTTNAHNSRGKGGGGGALPYISDTCVPRRFLKSHLNYSKDPNNG